jgi:methylase of polypeptide subunit release factors
VLSSTSDESATALGLVLRHLAGSNYRFITPTPLTHQRVLAHRGTQMATTLRDIFGWNMPFTRSCEAISRELLAAMRGAGVLQARGELLQSKVRVASIGDDLFVHSAYPTTQDDAVFFGPDTYRFARFVQHGVAHMRSTGSQPVRVLDVGCGTGAGGIVAARELAQIEQLGPVELCMNDINPVALRYTAINANLAGIAAKPALGNALRAVTGDFDLIISNPPYLEDAAKRAYRHGGAGLGRALSVRIAEESLGRLLPGGRLLMYTGVAIVGGVDAFLADMLPVLSSGQQGAQFDWSYSEIDPDVFGEELDQAAYAHVDRIAAVGLTVTRVDGKADAQ